MRFIFLWVMVLAVTPVLHPANAGALDDVADRFRSGNAWENSRPGTWLVHRQKEGRPAPNETVASRSAAVEVKVTGKARQTVTAVHPGPSPKQEKTSEAWWMIVSGLVILLMSVGAYFSPRTFMYGRRSWFWPMLIGERGTARMIRVISFPVGFVGILILLAGMITLFER